MGFFDWFFGDLFGPGDDVQAAADYWSTSGGWFEPDYRPGDNDIAIGRDFDPARDDEFTHGLWP